MTTRPYHSAILSASSQTRTDTPTWRTSQRGNRYLMISGKPATVIETPRGWSYVYGGEFQNCKSELLARLAVESLWRQSQIQVDITK